MINSAIQIAEAKIQNSPVAKWFNPNCELTILPMTPKNDDDPLHSTTGYAEYMMKRINLPDDRDYSSFPYDPKFIACIGQSNWDYHNRQIIIAHIEFDKMGDDHAKGCTVEELDIISKSLCDFPFCEVNTSTGGGGLHVRIPLSSPVTADDRSMIRQVNQYVLAQLQLPLADKVDHAALGRGVLWLWADRMNGDSFKSLNEATTTMDIDPQQVLDSAQQEVERNESMRQIGGDIENAVSAMLKIQKKQEKDGSRRLFAVCCRAVEHNLSDSQALAAVRYYENQFPFPRRYTDADILKRVEDAEGKGVMRGQAVLFPELTPWDNGDCGIKPTIDLDQSFSSVVQQTERALAANTYQRGGMLVRVDTEPEQCPLAVIDNGAPRIARIAKGAFIEFADQAARFMKFDGRTKKMRETLPDDRLLSCLFSRGHYQNIPLLNAVVERPILLSTGEIISRAGYDRNSGIYLIGTEGYPGLMSTDEAVTMLSDLYADFPLNGESDLSAVFAHLLTLAGLSIIPGPKPMFNFEANRPGCGKGLQLDVNSMIVEGRLAPKYPGTCGDDELRKVLCSIALSGQSQFNLDNVKGKFGNAVIESCLTTCRYNDRMLGRNENVDLPLQIVWAMTSNGVIFTTDMIRRIINIGMETDNPTPGQRNDFKYPNLLDHVKQNRPKLYMACLSILANHINAGCPDHGLPAMGSFEVWDRIVRRAIIAAGLADPFTILYVENEAIIEPEIAALHKAWIFNEPKTVKEIFQAVENEPHIFRGLKELLDSCDYGRPSNYLGQLLKRSRGLVVNGAVFDRTPHQTAKWFLSGVPAEERQTLTLV